MNWMHNDGIDAMNWPTPILTRPADTTGIEQLAADMKARMAAELAHERATTGIDRRHWTETTVPGSEDHS